MPVYVVCALTLIQYVLVYAFSPGYDVQSASTRNGMLYITGAPRYNHTGRVIIYRLNEKNNVVVSQILRGEQVNPLHHSASFVLANILMLR